MKTLKIALIYVLIAQGAVGKPTPVPTPSKVDQTCYKALHTCITLSQAQDREITQLKKDKETLAKDLTDATKAPFLPTWVWVTLGVMAGTVLGSKILK